MRAGGRGSGGRAGVRIHASLRQGGTDSFRPRPLRCPPCCSPSSPRCISAGLRAPSSTRPPRPSWSTRCAPSTPRASRRSSSPAARTSSSPTRASRARSSASPRAASTRDRRAPGGRGGRVVGRAGRALRGRRAGGDRVPVGHPGLRRRDADPERRRLRPGGRRDDHGRPRAGPPQRRGRDALPRRLRLRLPLERLQARPGPLARARRDLRARRGRRVGARCATPSSRGRSGSSSATARRWPRSARPCSACAAARAWSSTPATRTPSRRARSSRTRSSSPTRSPRSRRARASRRRAGRRTGA